MENVAAKNLSKEAKLLWQQFMSEGAAKYKVYDTYFSMIVPVALEERLSATGHSRLVFVLGVETGFLSDFIYGMCGTLIETELSRLHMKPVTIEFVVDECYHVADPVAKKEPAATEDCKSEKTAPVTAKKSRTPKTDKVAAKVEEVPDTEDSEAAAVARPLPTADAPYHTETGRVFNPKYTFNSFVMGSSNQLAWAASNAVAEHPGKRYNPLFIYGGVGLGKTHLLHAIGQYILHSRPKAKIIYCSAEEFVSEVVAATTGSGNYDTSKFNAFTRKYRQECDVLLIDDIQLISGKERTQTELFHIFNYLYEAGKQIVVTSDQLPQEIPDIAERLRSRFQQGLVADIQSPDLETRVAILQQKAKAEGIKLPAEVAQYIAKSLPSNVRKLEGALTSILAHVSLTGRPLTLDYAKQILTGIITTREEALSVLDIQKAVSNFYHIDNKALCSASRVKTVAQPRMVAMYLCRKHISVSYPALARDFKKKDHTTVLNAVRKIEKMLGKNDEELMADISSIERALNR